MNKFSKSSDNYSESFYYLIDSVDYNENNEVVKVTTNIIIDIEQYLESAQHRKIEDIFDKDIPPHILQNVKAWELLLD